MRRDYDPRDGHGRESFGADHDVPTRNSRLPLLPPATQRRSHFDVFHGMATEAGPIHNRSRSYVPSLSGLPASPHTPARGPVTSSTFSSPSSYRAEEDGLIFEFGSRYLRAGFAGESAPRCTLSFGPQQSRRIGDFRDFLPGYQSRPRPKENAQKWGADHELWRMDLREVDLGLVEDKVERAIRDAYNRYLLFDSKTRRLSLVLPSVMPHPLLSLLLSCLFAKFQIPGITLLSAPTLCVVAAGLRSGLVIDIGWHETTITAVYEYREVYQARTTRAMKLATLRIAMALQRLSGKPVDQDQLDVEFDHAEEVTTRMAWCRTYGRKRSGSTKGINERLQETHLQSTDDGPMVSIPLSSSSPKQTQVPFSTFCEPIESALLGTDSPPRESDDHEQPIDQLLYKALLSLPPDVRGICMARLIITGGGSNIPGLKSRLIHDLTRTVEQRGWDPVYGKAADNYRKTQDEIAQKRRNASSEAKGPLKRSEDTSDPPDTTPAAVIAALEPQVPDPIEEKLRREEAKGSKPTVAGVIRGVETLGAWAGASLVAGLRIKGIVEIERDVFLQHGMAGARRETEVSVTQSKPSHGPGLARAGGPEKLGWTLGAWA